MSRAMRSLLPVLLLVAATGCWNFDAAYDHYAQCGRPTACDPPCTGDTVCNGGACKTSLAPGYYENGFECDSPDICGSDYCQPGPCADLAKSTTNLSGVCASTLGTCATKNQACGPAKACCPGDECQGGTCCGTSGGGCWSDTTCCTSCDAATHRCR